MTDAIEIALISDDNDQVNSVAVWDIRTGACLLQYKGKIQPDSYLFTILNSFLIF